MKKVYLLFALLVSFSYFSYAQNFWTGLANNHLWGSPGNWTDGTPNAGDDVIIDNSFEGGSFTITMPNSQINVQSITISPMFGNEITVLLPTLNALSPSLTLTGNADVLTINNGGVFKNSSGVPANSNSIAFTDALATIRINNGGKLTHSSLGLSSYNSRLSTQPGTELGIFEYDTPLAAPPDISFSSVTFGTLMLSAVTAGGAKSYTEPDVFNTIIRGDFIMNPGTGFFLSTIGDVTITGNLVINGNFNFSPQSLGINNRSIRFNNITPTGQTISGSGNFTLGANFRILQVLANAKVILQRNINLPNAANRFAVGTAGILYITGTNIITGAGEFALSTQGSYLGIGSPDGITSAPTMLGNIQTNIRSYFTNVSSFEYTGPTAQVTGNGLNGTVRNLIINNSSNDNVTLSSNVSINNQLTLNKGFLTTNQPAQLTLNLATNILSPASNYAAIPNIGWEKSFVNGPINAQIDNTSGTRWMPVGKISGTDTVFAPTAITKFNDFLNTYMAEYFPQTHNDVENIENPPLDHVSHIEFWDINCIAGNANDKAARITLTWRPSSKVGNGNPNDNQQALNDLNIAHYFDNGNGIKWRLDAPNATFSVGGTNPDGYGTVSTDQFVTTFSPFTLGTTSAFNVLPVKDLKFSGKETKSNIVLQWDTKEEQGIISYEIEKSSNGISFSKIGAVAGKNNIISNSYSFLDENPANGWNYYKLKIIEQNKTTYSSIIKVNFGKPEVLLIYPNPVYDELGIKLPVSSSKYTITIVNVNGQTVKSIISADQNVTVDVNGLSKGTYFLRITNGSKTFIEKFNKL